jgi:hypothetical protein
MMSINSLQKNMMVNRVIAFFKVKNEEKFWYSFSIILFSSIFGAATFYLYLSRTTITLTNSPPGSLLYGLVIAASIITTFLGWFLSNLGYQGVSLFFGSHGNLKRMLTLSGYASIPMLFQAASRFVYFFLSGEKPNLAVSKSLFSILLEHFTIFSIITLILTVYAISENYNLSLKKSTLIALIPILLLIIVRFSISRFSGNRLLILGAFFS